MQLEFWSGTGRESDAGGTSRPFFPTPRASDSERGGRGELLHVAKGAETPRGPLGGGSISSRAASRARTSRTRGPVPAYPASDPASGSSSPALFALWNPGTCSWRTSQLSLLGGWTPFSGRWPRSGTMRSGSAYRLPPLVPRISGTGSSSWPTPIPTPSASGFECRDVGRMLERREECKKKHGNGNGFGLTLGQFVAVYPTPRASDWRSGSVSEQTHGKNSRPLCEQIVRMEASGDSTRPTSLNPAWVEWLMGFPIGWTDCEDSAMPSCPPSPSSSDGESSPPTEG